MESAKPKVPREAVQLYNLFIHGEISRRDFVAGVQRFAVGGLTATAVIDALMPNYAQGQQVSRTDDRIHTSYETIPSPQGNGFVRGYLVRPVSADTRNATASKLPGIIVIHENRGLNPHIEDIARRFALANFMAFAPDGLTSVGGFPGDDYNGGLLFSKIDPQKMMEDFIASALWLKARTIAPRSESPASVTEATLPTPWPSASDRIFWQLCRFMAPFHWRATFQTYARRFWSTMANSTPVSPQPGRRTMRH